MSTWTCKKCGLITHTNNDLTFEKCFPKECCQDDYRSSFMAFVSGLSVAVKATKVTMKSKLGDIINEC